MNNAEMQIKSEKVKSQPKKNRSHISGGFLRESEILKNAQNVVDKNIQNMKKYLLRKKCKEGMVAVLDWLGVHSISRSIVAIEDKIFISNKSNE